MSFSATRFSTMKPNTNLREVVLNKIFQQLTPWWPPRRRRSSPQPQGCALQTYCCRGVPTSSSLPALPLPPSSSHSFQSKWNWPRAWAHWSENKLIKVIFLEIYNARTLKPHPVILNFISSPCSRMLFILRWTFSPSTMWVEWGPCTLAGILQLNWGLVAFSLATHSFSTFFKLGNWVQMKFLWKLLLTSFPSIILLPMVIPMASGSTVGSMVARWRWRKG